jgi:hypothetical protein
MDLLRSRDLDSELAAFEDTEPVRFETVGGSLRTWCYLSSNSASATGSGYDSRSETVSSNQPPSES